MNAEEGSEKVRMFQSRTYDLPITTSTVFFRWWLGETRKKPDCAKGVEFSTLRVLIRMCFSDVDSSELGRAILFVQ